MTSCLHGLQTINERLTKVEQTTGVIQGSINNGQPINYTNQTDDILQRIQTLEQLVAEQTKIINKLKKSLKQ